MERRQRAMFGRLLHWCWRFAILACSITGFSSRFVQIVTNRLPFYDYKNDIRLTLAIAQGMIPLRDKYPELLENNGLWEVLEAC